MNAVAHLVEDTLAEYGALTRDALKAYLPNREPRRFLWDLVADYPSRGGKMLRPSLCIAAARAFGASAEKAVRTAVSLELLHNALLVHDDIEDESLERRGQQALHVKHGIPLAINVGDTLTLLSLAPLLDNIRVIGAERSLDVLREFEHVGRETAEGQALELGWRAENNCAVSADDYLLMVLKKTCWLTTILPVRLGALIAAGRRVDRDRFFRFGFFLGAAFQIHDDVLNLEAQDVYGKERDGDLWEGKRTLVLIRLHALSSTQDRGRIETILAAPREQKQPADIRWLRERIDALACLEHTRHYAMGIAGAARAEFEAAFQGIPPSRDRDFILALTQWAFERER
ncbi:MAG: polyprenyl synthetase family protein [Pseudomonadales bacterium]|nr:polyprenyl synthetase family protein [Pseudomonadales bacterium]